jgi:hypothetical protein
MSSPFPGPTPPYSNPPIEPQYYQPSQFFISNITLGVNTTITTTKNMNYVIGQQIRLIIPPSFGTRQLNEQTGYVIAIPQSNQVVVDIFSIGMDQFINSTATTKPQILAIGDINSGPINPNGKYTITSIPGSFINISPA